MGLSWKPLLTCKYYGEISSNSVWTASKSPPYIFSLRWEIACFHFAVISPSQNRYGCRFQESFFRISFGTYLTQQKKYCGNRCELSNRSWAAVTWQWSSSHLLSLKRFLSLPRLATPLEKKVCCLGERTRASLCLQKKNRRSGRSNGTRSGACALILRCVIAKCLY